MLHFFLYSSVFARICVNRTYFHPQPLLASVAPLASLAPGVLEPFFFSICIMRLFIALSRKPIFPTFSCISIILGVEVTSWTLACPLSPSAAAAGPITSPLSVTLFRGRFVRQGFASLNAFVWMHARRSVSLSYMFM